MTNTELIALCDGATDEDVSVLVPIEDMLRLGAIPRVSQRYEDGCWVQVTRVRELVARDS